MKKTWRQWRVASNGSESGSVTLVDEGLLRAHRWRKRFASSGSEGRERLRCQRICGPLQGRALIALRQLIPLTDQESGRSLSSCGARSPQQCCSSPRLPHAGSDRETHSHGIFPLYRKSGLPTDASPAKPSNLQIFFSKLHKLTTRNSLPFTRYSPLLFCIRRRRQFRGSSRT